MIKIKGILFLGNKNSYKLHEVIKKHGRNIIIIVTESSIYSILKKEYPQYEIILVDLFNEQDAGAKIKFTNELISLLGKNNKNKIFENVDLVFSFINEIHTKSIKLILNIIESISEILEKNNISKLILIEGNRDVEYFCCFFAEGERSYQFLYKRSWFFNYYIFQSFKEQVSIFWEHETPQLKLKIFRWLRNYPRLYLGFSKAIFRTIKYSLAKKSNYKNISYRANTKIVFLMVRIPIQVDPLISLYMSLKNDKSTTPVFLVFDDSCKHEVEKILKKRRCVYILLDEYLNLKDIIKFIFLKKIFNIPKGEKIPIIFKGKTISLGTKEILKEISSNWMKMIIRIGSLNKFLKSVGKNNIDFLVNTETFGSEAATMGIWASRYNISIFSIQHVAIGERLLPKMLWTNAMFMMSNKNCKKIKEISGDRNFIYVGPMAYDQYFNTSKSNYPIKKIAIFTQPDSYTCEYIKIINDTLDIRNELELNWEIIVKLHPREKKYKMFKNKYKNYSKLKVIKNEIISSDLIKEIDLTISISSGVILQSIIIGTPVLSINYNTNKYLWVNKNVIGFLKENVVRKIFTKDEFKCILEDSKDLINEFKKNRSYFLQRDFCGYNGDGADKFLNYIKKNRATLK